MSKTTGKEVGYSLWPLNRNRPILHALGQKAAAVPSFARSAAAVVYRPHAPLQPLKDFTACVSHWHFQGSRRACPPPLLAELIVIIYLDILPLHSVLSLFKVQMLCSRDIGSRLDDSRQSFHS